MLPFAGVVSLSLATLVLLACSGGEATPTPSASANVISSDLSVGPNRMVFFLLDSDSNPIKTSEADVSIYYSAGTSEGGPKKVSKARFRQWPLGELGVYTVQVNLEQAGGWGIQVAVKGTDGSSITAKGNFIVKEKSSTPSIGATAPPSRNKIGRDVSSLDELTTARPPDPELYTMTIAEALASGKPLLVVLGTPAFCETATCGPQVEVVQGIKDRYKDRANFIYVEVWDNPHLILGDLSKARTVPAVEEWGIPSEPWTFIVDSQGRIASKCEAFTTAEELEENLQKVLQ